MAQLFRLRLTDNIETVDFISADNTYQVEDGGFDIGLPNAKQEIAPVRYGFYMPVSSIYEYRDATISFVINATTRSGVIAAMNKIERILHRAANKGELDETRKVELSYSWAGAENITYFEVYGGQATFSEDVLSVAKIHSFANGEYGLPECRVSLVLSPYGYGLSLYSEVGAAQEVPLYNPTIGAKQTGGVMVRNPGVGRYNYVEIAAVDVPGSQPLVTKIQINDGSPYSAWKSIYIGHQLSPYPTKLVFDGEDASIGSGASKTDTDPAGGTEGNAYTTLGFAGPYTPGIFPAVYWEVDHTTVGSFFAFLHGVSPGYGTNFKWSLGVFDYVAWGILRQEPWAGNSQVNLMTAPLTPINLPPVSPQLSNYGSMESYGMGLWAATSTVGAASFPLDYLSLLPIGHGLRVWRARREYLTGTMVDDGWRGVEYLKDGSNLVYAPFYGVMEPIRLEPGISQRLYFTSSSVNSDYTRQLTVRVFAVPTYLSLAL